jgi:hypothetical protein
VPSASSALATERAFLERARQALAGGAANQARRALRAYATRCRPGQLEEEARVLGIRLAVVSGALARARRQLAGFRRRYPRSLFLPTMERLLDTAGGAL